MMRTLLIPALVALLFATTSDAQELPPIPEGGLITVNSGACTDDVSGETGQCVIQVDMKGRTYVVFKQDGRIIFIRRQAEEGFITLYEYKGTPV